MPNWVRLSQKMTDLNSKLRQGNLKANDGNDFLLLGDAAENIAV